MPQVQQYAPNQIATPTTRGARASVQNVQPAIRPGQIESVVRAGLGIKQRIDKTAAEEALVKFERDKNDLFFNADSGYFNTQGRNAYDGAADTNTALEKLKTQYGGTLSGAALNMFDGAAANHITRASNDIGKHASNGLRSWETATRQAQVENTLENASLYWNDPDRMRVQQVLGEQSVLESAQQTGIGPEATNEKLQTFRSAFAANTIKAATVNSSANGKRALDKFGDRLEGPLKAQLGAIIEKKIRAENIKYIASSTVLTSTNLVRDYDNRSDIIEEVNKIKNAKLRKATMQESMARFSQKRQAESEQRADNYDAAETSLAATGSTKAFEASNPDAWDDLTQAQRSSLSTGLRDATSFSKFSDIMILPKKELAKVDLNDVAPLLNKSHREKVLSAVRVAKGIGTKVQKVDAQVGRTRGKQMSDAIVSLAGKSKAKFNDDDRDQMESFYSLVDDEVEYRESQKGSPLSSDEFTDLVSGLTRDAVTKGSFWGFTTTSIDNLGDMSVENQEINAALLRSVGSNVTSQSLFDVDADRLDLIEFMRENNIDITSANIIKAYEQARR